MAYKGRSKNRRQRAEKMADFCSAAANGDSKGVESLLKEGKSPNDLSSDGNVPLCIAAFWGNADIVKALLEHGADVNLRNASTGWTACHCAAFQGHGKVLLRLMDRTPDLTIKDKLGRTAADFASALDTVWPFFAAAGFRRTAKDDLIRLDIIKKEPANPEPPNEDLNAGNIPSSALSRGVKSHFSRPGSSYLLQMQPSPALKQSKAAAAALLFGDVLSEDN